MSSFDSCIAVESYRVKRLINHSTAIYLDFMHRCYLGIIFIVHVRIAFIWSIINFMVENVSCQPNRGKLNDARFQNTVNGVLEDVGLRFFKDILKSNALVRNSDINGTAIVSDIVDKLQQVFENRKRYLYRTRNATLNLGFQKTTSQITCCNILGETFYNSLTGLFVDFNETCFVESPFLSDRPKTYPPVEGRTAMFDNFIENRRDFLIQYIATEEGTMVFYPRVYVPNLCGNYDPRTRNWYVGAANRQYKSIAFVVDTSSLSSTQITKDTYISDVSAALAIVLGTLGSKDEVALVAHPNSISSDGKDYCFLDRLVQLSASVSKGMPTVLKQIRYVGLSNYSVALERGLNLLSENADSDKQQILFFFTAHMSTNDCLKEWRAVFEMYLQNGSINWVGLPVLLIYGLGQSDQLKQDLSLLKSVYPAKAMYFQLKNQADVQQVLTYYRNIPYNLKSTLHQTALFISPNAKHLHVSLSLPIIDENENLLGVSGLDIDYDLFLNAILQPTSGTTGSYPFLVDQYDKILLYHPLHDLRTDLQGIHVKQLESSPSASHFIERILNDSEQVSPTQGVVQSPVLQNFTIVSSVSKKRNVTMFYGNVRIPGSNVRLAVCYVSVPGGTRVLLMPVENSTSKDVNFFYHRADLQNQSLYSSESYCYTRAGDTLSEQVFTLVSFPGFLDPPSKLVKEETTADVRLYTDIVQGSSSNTAFQGETLTEVTMLSDIDDLWTIGPLSYDLSRYFIVRKAGTQFGAAKFYPGPTSIAVFDIWSEPWYAAARGKIDEITFTVPYHEVYDQEHVVVTVAKPVFYHNTTTLFGVLAGDLSLEYINHLLLTSFWEDCASADYYCFLLDTNGYIVFHQKWLVTDRDDDSIIGQHIIEEEPRIAAHLFHNKYLVKQSCQNRYLEQKKYYYRVDFTAVNHLDNGSAQYKATSVPGSNCFVFQTAVTSRVTTNEDECMCTPKNETMCKLNATDCECPCNRRVVFDTCASLSTRTDWTPCAKKQGESLDKINEWTLGKIATSPCTGIFCPKTVFREVCESVALCQWCRKNNTEDTVDHVCAAYPSCQGGAFFEEFRVEKRDQNYVWFVSALSALLVVTAAISIVSFYTWRKGLATVHSITTLSSRAASHEWSESGVESIEMENYAGETESISRKRRKGSHHHHHRKRRKTAAHDVYSGQETMDSGKHQHDDDEPSVPPVYDVNAFLSDVYNESSKQSQEYIKSYKPDNISADDTITETDSEDKFSQGGSSFESENLTNELETSVGGDNELDGTQYNFDNAENQTVDGPRDYNVIGMEHMTDT